MPASEVLATQEVLEDVRPGRLVQGDPVTCRGRERRARPHWNLEPPLALKSALLERGRSLAQVVDAVDVDRAVTLEVVGQQDVRWALGQLDHRHARTHALDGKCKSGPQYLCENPNIGGDVAARRVEVVELEE